ncbi:phage tail protein [Rhodovibrio salinarum]|uniref:Phage tail protein n=1 Tax=Rhodovibrio salinarum TaxID=1087 RepID=A0A934QIY1_9PROT|nr:phage tail protein [Rhodovibrio salinarum]MBK1697400.1 phage tail protein [Rhodovibrio salinarum]
MTSHPLLNFHFTVEWGGTRLGFTRVEGLTAETDVTYYREGNSPEYAPRPIPTVIRYADIVLHRGIVAGDNDLYAWFRTVEGMKAERRDIRIALLNEEHTPVVVWRVKGAFIRKIEGPALSGTGDYGGIAIERMVLAHDGFTIEHG